MKEAGREERRERGREREEGRRHTSNSSSLISASNVALAPSVLPPAPVAVRLFAGAEFEAGGEEPATDGGRGTDSNLCNTNAPPRPAPPDPSPLVPGAPNKDLRSFLLATSPAPLTLARTASFSPAPFDPAFCPPAPPPSSLATPPTRPLSPLSGVPAATLATNPSACPPLPPPRPPSPLALFLASAFAFLARCFITLDMSFEARGGGPPATPSLCTSHQRTFA